MPLQNALHLADRVAGDKRNVLDRAPFPPPLGDERAAQIVEGDAADLQDIRRLSGGLATILGGNISAAGGEQ